MPAMQTAPLRRRLWCTCSWVLVRVGGRWFSGGEPKRLTAVVHRRAELLRPSPSVPTRGLRCLGRGGERGGGAGEGGRGMSDRCGALDVA